METCIIKSVKIEKLWGIKDIECDLNEDVNIIIGANGSGKSTFLNLIEGVLQCDVPTLLSVQFKSVTLSLNSADRQFIKLTQEHDEDSPFFTYDFGGKVQYKFSSYDYRRGRTSFRNSVIDDIRIQLNEIVNISWLSVNRFNLYLERDRVENRPFGGIEVDDNLVNTKLRTLMHDLVVYRLRLGNHINQLGTKQNQEVFSLLLFNKEYDVYNPGKVQAFAQLDPKSAQASLFKIFNQLGISSEKKDDILEHIKAMSGVVDKVQQKQNLNLNDVFPLSLINRTMQLIEISKKYTAESERIMEPVNNYIKCLQRFMEDKEFSFSDNSGELHIDIKPIFSKHRERELVGVKSISYNSLSSGEKQLLILLTQTLLLENKRFVFIADEPELSLHIDWQHKIIGAIRELNPNAQIIVATHSPEIAGLWKENITNLQNVTTYGE